MAKFKILSFIPSEKNNKVAASCLFKISLCPKAVISLTTAYANPVEKKHPSVMISMGVEDKTFELFYQLKTSTPFDAEKKLYEWMSSAQIESFVDDLLSEVVRVTGLKLEC